MNQGAREACFAYPSTLKTKASWPSECQLTFTRRYVGIMGLCYAGYWMSQPSVFKFPSDRSILVLKSDHDERSCFRTRLNGFVLCSVRECRSWVCSDSLQLEVYVCYSQITTKGTASVLGQMGLCYARYLNEAAECVRAYSYALGHGSKSWHGNLTEALCSSHSLHACVWRVCSIRPLLPTHPFQLIVR
jgi:hypothetical protein